MLVYIGLSNSIRVSYDVAKAIVKSICVNEVHVSHTSWIHLLQINYRTRFIVSFLVRCLDEHVWLINALDTVTKLNESYIYSQTTQLPQTAKCTTSLRFNGASRNLTQICATVQLCLYSNKYRYILVYSLRYTIIGRLLYFPLPLFGCHFTDQQPLVLWI